MAVMAMCMVVVGFVVFLGTSVSCGTMCEDVPTECAGRGGCKVEGRSRGNVGSSVQLCAIVCSFAKWEHSAWGGVDPCGNRGAECGEYLGSLLGGLSVLDFL